MDYINKQKFLTELGRLLTFMYEEDRQKALSMYTRIFDETEDEQGLLQLLGSPTRQAVVIARTYDAKERKLQVQAQARDEYAAPELDERPPFVLAIEQIAQQAAALAAPKNYVSKDQFSLFDEPEQEKPEESTEEPVAPESEEEAETAPAEAEEETEPEEKAEVEEKTEAAPVKLTPDEKEDGFELPAAQTEEPVLAEESTVPEFRMEDDSVPEDLRQAVSKVDSFLADLSMEDELFAEAEAEEKHPAEKAAARMRKEEIWAETEQTERKLVVWKLIPFLLLGIPLTLIGIVLLLVPALLFLALACAAIYCGVMTFSAVFSGFSMLADKLVLIGAAIALLALGLLFLWIFIWFLGGAIAGLIRGVFSLGRKWCSKEVAKP